MKINPYIFRGYDIRGIVDQDLNENNVEAIGKAYGTFLQKRKIRQAIVGRDCRLSGEKFQKAFMKGMTKTGIDLIDLGMVMTQMVYFGQYRFQINGGAMITASHNPFNFNGFKLASGFSKTVETEELQEMRKTIENEKFFKSSKKGKIEKKDITEDYINDLLKRIKLKKKFKIVIDAGNGITGIYLPKILKRIECKVIGQNLKPDGNFPAGTPDPTGEKMMLRVRQTVLKEKADIGFAFDGDGDRIGTVDEKGNILWNDILVAIFSKEILERFSNQKIIHNDLCSQTTNLVIKQMGGIPIMWRTGHGFIRSKVAKEKAIFGGELSGHFFFADNAYGYDDGTYAVLRLLEYLSEKNLSLHEVYKTFPQYISSPEIKIGCSDEKKEKVIEHLSKKFKKDFPKAKIFDKKIIRLSDYDGIRADFSDGMMIFRYSQNGPYITVKFEAKDKKTYNKRKKYIREVLESYPEIIWQDQLCINLECLKS